MREKQKNKPSPNVQKYKFSVTFPKKILTKSIPNSAQKSNKNDIEFQSDKKEDRSRSKNNKKK